MAYAQVATILLHIAGIQERPSPGAITGISPWLDSNTRNKSRRFYTIVALPWITIISKTLFGRAILVRQSNYKRCGSKFHSRTKSFVFLYTSLGV